MMKKTSTFLSVTFTIVLLAIFSLNTNFDEHSAEYLSKNPSVSTLHAQEYSQSILQNSEKDIVFIENLGQITDTEGEKRPEILFLTRSEGVDMYMTSSGLSYVFRNAESGHYRLEMEFVGMNKGITIKKELAIEQQYHYYTPEYPDGISPNAYKKFTMENLYEGIDLVYYEKEGRLKYDFIVKAGADAGKIKMKYKGASSMKIDNNGNVIITTPTGEIREEKPYTYSKNTGLEIESSYRLKNNTILFDIAENETSEDIIIDPIRIWATYYGGSDYDGGHSICTDSSGNLYVTGRTASSNFPTQELAGAYYQSAYGGGDYDVFILKFNSSGVRLWATYYGGSDSDCGNDWDLENSLSICTVNSGNLYVTGSTKSTDFPTQTLAGAYNQTTYAGGISDAFILKFNSNGVRLWATYYGGSDLEKGGSICTDNSGNLYVAGYTLSSDFPTQILTGAYNQTTNAGIEDAFILKFDSSGARIWATYYGGSSTDYEGIACTDNSDNLYVVGRTWGNNFPTQTLSGAYNQSTSGGGYDVFILKFNSSCERLWSTYYGGNGNDVGRSICIDNSDNLFVTGHTWGSTFPTQNLTGAYNDSTGNGQWDGFILKFNNSGTRLWATYYGGSEWDSGLGICTDNSGNLYVTGSTESSNFPTQTLTGAYNQTLYGGGFYDAFILKFNSNSARIWATYYGGNEWDFGGSICTDISGNLYVTGATESSNFPTQTLTGAYNQSTSSGGYDVFLLRFSDTYASFIASDDTICEGTSVNFTDQSGGNIISWNWTFEGGTPPNSTLQNPTVTYNDQGDYDVELIVSDETFSDTLLIEDYISVLMTPPALLLPFDDVCLTDPPFELTGGSPAGGVYSGPGVSNGWFDPAAAGIGTHTITYIYTAGNGCDNYDEETILVDPCTGVDEIEAGIISIYPNPFNTATRFDYQLEQPGNVVLTIYNPVGKRIETLIDEYQSQGEHKAVWDAHGLPPGIYFYKIQVGAHQITGTMVLLR